MKGRAMALLVVAGCSAACGVGHRAWFSAARGPGEPLMPPLSSFMEPTAARVALGHPVQWRVHSDLKRRGAWAAPGYRDMWVEVAEHRFSSHVGTLRLHFCNGHLHDTRFYPVDQQAVMAAVEQQLGRRFLRRKEWNHSLVKATPNVFVTAGEDGLGTRYYVSWSDGRLLDESDAWWDLFAAGRQDWE